MGSVSVNSNYDKAEERQYKRCVRSGEVSEYRSLVDDHRLQRGQYGASQDGHDKAGSTKLRIVAQTIEGNTVDGGEHE